MLLCRFLAGRSVVHSDPASHNRTHWTLYQRPQHVALEEAEWIEGVYRNYCYCDYPVGPSGLSPEGTCGESVPGACGDSVSSSVTLLRPQRGSNPDFPLQNDPSVRSARPPMSDQGLEENQTPAMCSAARETPQTFEMCETLGTQLHVFQDMV